MRRPNLRWLCRCSLWPSLALLGSAASCAEPREEHVVAPVTESTDGSESESGEPQDELQGCGCPAVTEDLEADCDVQLLLAAFSSCDDEYDFTLPCPVIESACDGEPINPAAVDCVLEHAAAGDQFIYAEQRDACDDSGPYVVVVRAQRPGPLPRYLGLECYSHQGSQIPFEAMFSWPDAFELCQAAADPAARLACLQARLGFAEPERTRCP